MMWETFPSEAEQLVAAPVRRRISIDESLEDILRSSVKNFRIGLHNIFTK